jgi:hypothetical protein
MKKLPMFLGAVVAGWTVAAAAKRLRPPLAPEGSWKDASIKPSTNGSHSV